MFQICTIYTFIKTMKDDIHISLLFISNCVTGLNFFRSISTHFFGVHFFSMCIEISRRSERSWTVRTCIFTFSGMLSHMRLQQYDKFSHTNVKPEKNFTGIHKLTFKHCLTLNDFPQTRQWNGFKSECFIRMCTERNFVRDVEYSHKEHCTRFVWRFICCAKDGLFLQLKKTIAIISEGAAEYCVLFLYYVTLQYEHLTLCLSGGSCCCMCNEYLVLVKKLLPHLEHKYFTSPCAVDRWTE